MCWLLLVLDRHVAPLHSDVLVLLVLLVVLERLARPLLWFVPFLVVDTPYEQHVQPTCDAKDRSGDSLGALKGCKSVHN